MKVGDLNILESLATYNSVNYKHIGIQPKGLFVLLQTYRPRNWVTIKTKKNGNIRFSETGQSDHDPVR